MFFLLTVVCFFDTGLCLFRYSASTRLHTHQPRIQKRMIRKLHLCDCDCESATHFVPVKRHARSKGCCQAMNDWVDELQFYAMLGAPSGTARVKFNYMRRALSSSTSAAEAVEVSEQFEKLANSSCLP